MEYRDDLNVVWLDEVHQAIVADDEFAQTMEPVCLNSAARLRKLFKVICGCE